MAGERGRRVPLAAEDSQRSPLEGGLQVLFHSARMGDGDIRTEIGRDDRTPHSSPPATNSLITVSIHQIQVISGSERVGSRNSICCLFQQFLSSPVSLSPLGPPRRPAPSPSSPSTPHAFWHMICHLSNPLKNRPVCELVFKPLKSGSRYQSKCSLQSDSSGSNASSGSIPPRLLYVPTQTVESILSSCSQVYENHCLGRFRILEVD